MKSRFNEYGLHAVILVVLIVIPLMMQIESSTLNAKFMSHFWVMIFSLIVTFYGNYLYGIDKLFYKKKYLWFVLFNVLIIIFNDFVENAVHACFEESQPQRVERIRSRMVHTIFLYNRLIYTILGIGAALAVRYSRKLIDSEKERKQLETEKLTSEISLLKYQMQPHFFFNTLNNIYSLISKSPSDAQKAVHSLSKMMRYILYENTSDTISLDKEIDFIENYNKLMLLRMNSNVRVQFDVPNDVSNVNIPPLLLIPLVENAYKHGISAQNDSFISCCLSIKNNMLTFKVENSLSNEPKEDRSHSGIGLQNLRKRLEIIYGSNATFEANETEYGTFVAMLELPIKTSH